jgi:hypothetical protein
MSAGVRQTFDEAGTNRINHTCEHNRYRVGRLLQGPNGRGVAG